MQRRIVVLAAACVFVFVAAVVCSNNGDAQEMQNDIEARLEQLKKLQKTGVYSAEEIAAAKKDLLLRLTNPTPKTLQIAGEYLVRFQESEMSRYRNARLRGGALGGGLDQDTFCDDQMGTKVWVLKQNGDVVQIDEYVYYQDAPCDADLSALDGGPQKQFVRRLPITKVVVDSDVVRIRYITRFRSLDGRIAVDTTSLAVRDDGSGQLSGEYERAMSIEPAGTWDRPMVAKGNVTLLRNLEDKPRASDLEF